MSDFGSKSFKSKRGWYKLLREVFQFDSIRWLPPRPHAQLKPDRHERLLYARERAYSRFDEARQRTATYTVIGNGAGLVGSFAFVAERQSLSEGAAFVVVPTVLFFAGLVFGFISLYLSELYRRFQVKTISFTIAGNEDARASFREWRVVMSGVLRLFRSLAIISFGVAVAITLLNLVDFASDADRSEGQSSGVASAPAGVPR
ncbi:MAG: hypothetical protein EOP74_02535 [Variovorax sp.]|nr:MAG: hypothetical protein EOP74_02535 [Variovorax sp.]